MLFITQVFIQFRLEYFLYPLFKKGAEERVKLLFALELIKKSPSEILIADCP